MHEMLSGLGMVVSASGLGMVVARERLRMFAAAWGLGMLVTGNLALMSATFRGGPADAETVTCSVKESQSRLNSLGQAGAGCAVAPSPKQGSVALALVRLVRERMRGDEATALGGNGGMRALVKAVHTAEKTAGDGAWQSVQQIGGETSL